MTSGIALICFLIAFVLFVLAAFGVGQFWKISTIAAGLAAFTFPFLYLAWNAHF